MDMFDWLMVLPAGRGGSPERTREESVAAGIGMTAFPLLDFILVLFAGIWAHAVSALFLLPLCFALLSFLLCRRLEVGTGWTLRVTMGSGFACFVTSGIALLLGIFGSFYSSF